MDANSVKAIRDSLKYNEGDKSIKIAFDNGVVLSSTSDIILWNDANEIIIGIVADSDDGAYVADKPIRVICSTYENIQFIMSNINTKDIKDTLDGLSSVVKISDEEKNNITKWYEKLYDYRYELSHKNYNPIDIKRD